MYHLPLKEAASWRGFFFLGPKEKRGSNKGTNFFLSSILVGWNPPNQKRGEKGHLAGGPRKG